jgi:PLP dependent protein
MTEEKRERLSLVQEKIRAAAAKSGRKDTDITLVAVSKTKPWDDVEAFARLGVRVFGENYVQEALEKQNTAKALGIRDLEWHLIGTLQSNKAKFVPGNFSLFHALDSFSLAQKIDKTASAANVKQSCLLEVNVDLEDSKGGIAADALARLLEQLNSLTSLELKGLMCIPAPKSNRDPRAPFAALREMRDQLNAKGAYRAKLEHLSMGMSSDFEAAILEGATFVRVGTVLFGERARK